MISDKLETIKESLDKEVKQFEEERSLMLEIIEKLKDQVKSLLQQKNNTGEGGEAMRLENKILKRKLNELLKI